MDWMTPLLAVVTTGILILLVTRFGPGNANWKRPEAAPPRRCSFCRKSQHEVKKLIAGPDVHICDECVGLCKDILAEDSARDEASPSGQPGPSPPPAPNSERLLQICRALSTAAHTMRRIWIIEDPESATIIQTMADRIAALAQELRAEIPR